MSDQVFAQPQPQPSSSGDRKIIWVGKDAAEDSQKNSINAQAEMQDDAQDNNMSDKNGDKHEQEEYSGSNSGSDNGSGSDSGSDDTNKLLSLHPFYLMMETFLKHNDQTTAQILAEMSQNIKSLSDSIRELKKEKLQEVDQVSNQMQDQ